MVERNGGPRSIRVPDFMAELIERIAFEAREDSGSIGAAGCRSACRSACWTTCSRTRSGAPSSRKRRRWSRISDVYAALPAITGKLELEYEGSCRARRRSRRT